MIRSIGSGDGTGPGEGLTADEDMLLTPEDKGMKVIRGLVGGRMLVLLVVLVLFPVWLTVATIPLSSDVLELNGLKIKTPATATTNKKPRNTPATTLLSISYPPIKNNIL
jgi:hypothetical protein